MNRVRREPGQMFVLAFLFEKRNFAGKEVDMNGNLNYTFGKK